MHDYDHEDYDPETFQMIQEAAYYKWLSNDGCVDSQTCWLQAEEEFLRNKISRILARNFEQLDSSN